MNFNYNNHRIREVFWEITTRCNAKCIHCSVTRNRTPIENEERARTILSKMINAGIDNITITGGEPTLYDLQSILKDVDTTKINVRVCTNGVRLTPELICFFNEKSIGYNVSFHSLQPRNQLSIYQVETPWVTSLINFLLEKGQKDLFAMNTILLRDNLAEIVPIALHLNAKPENIRKWRIIYPIVAGQMAKNTDHLVDPKRVAEIHRALKDLDLKYPLIFNSIEGGEEICHIEDRDEVYVTNYGTLRPCVGFTHFETEGSLLDCSVEELLSEKVMNFWISEYDPSGPLGVKCKVHLIKDTGDLTTLAKNSTELKKGRMSS